VRLGHLPSNREQENSVIPKLLTHVTFDAPAAPAALAAQQAARKMTGADPANRLQSPTGRAMTTPVHSVRHFTSPPAAPGTQQKRSIFSLATAGFEAGNLEYNLKHFRSIIGQHNPGLGDASFKGFHGTSQKNMSGILAGGFETGRSGENFHGFSLDGPGLYVAEHPYLAIDYGAIAAGAQETVQLLAVFRQPDTEGSKRIPSEDEAWEFNEDGTISTRISPDALASVETSYVGVPLPPIPPAELENAKMWLVDGLQKK
jgi:hypothetical protein